MCFSKILIFRDNHWGSGHPNYVFVLDIWLDAEKWKHFLSSYVSSVDLCTWVSNSKQVPPLFVGESHFQFFFLFILILCNNLYVASCYRKLEWMTRELQGEGRWSRINFIRKLKDHWATPNHILQYWLWVVLPFHYVLILYVNSVYWEVFQ